MSRRVEDLSGKIYNRWTVIKFSHLNAGSHWLCQCQCGTVKTVRRNGLISGTSQSCGCFNTEMSRKKNTLKNGEASFNKLYTTYRLAAKEHNRVFELTKKELRKLTLANCHYCGSLPSNIKKKNSVLGQDYVYNGIDRKDNDIGYTVDNSITCCKFCNQAKHTHTYEEFMAWIDRIKHNVIVVDVCNHEWQSCTGVGRRCNKCGKGV